jgi:GAF domain-containing protein
VDRPDTGSIFATLAKGTEGRVSMASLVRGCLELCPADGVSLSLIATGQAEGASAASEGLATMAQDLEFSLGEGPGTDAFAFGGPVLVADTVNADGRWPHFLRAAERAGVRAVYAFPLRIGAAKLGILTLYRSKPASLSDVELATSLAVADAVTQILVGLQSGSEPETLSSALEDGAAFRSVVHQATGVLAARLACSIEEALVRLRGAAFAAGRTLPEVAADIVSGALTIERA